MPLAILGFAGPAAAQEDEPGDVDEALENGAEDSFPDGFGEDLDETSIDSFSPELSAGVEGPDLDTGFEIETGVLDSNAAGIEDEDHNDAVLKPAPSQTAPAFEVHRDGADSVVAADLADTEFRVGVADGEVWFADVFHGPDVELRRSASFDYDDLVFERNVASSIGPVAERLVLSEDGFDFRTRPEGAGSIESASATRHGEVQVEVSSIESDKESQRTSRTRHWASRTGLKREQYRRAKSSLNGSVVEVDSGIEVYGYPGTVRISQRAMFGNGDAPLITHNQVSFDGEELTSGRSGVAEKNGWPKGFPSEFVLSEALSSTGGETAMMTLTEIVHPDFDPARITREYVFQKQNTKGTKFGVEVVEKEAGEVTEKYTILVSPRNKRAELVVRDRDGAPTGRVVSTPAVAQIDIGPPNAKVTNQVRRSGDTGVGTYHGFRSGVTVTAALLKGHSQPLLGMERSIQHQHSNSKISRSDTLEYYPKTRRASLSFGDQVRELNHSSETKLTLNPNSGIVVQAESSNFETGLAEQLVTGFQTDGEFGYELVDNIEHRADVRLTDFEEAAIAYLQNNPGDIVRPSDWKERIGLYFPTSNADGLRNKIETINSQLPADQPAFWFDGPNQSNVVFADRSKPRIPIVEGLEFDTAYRALRTDGGLVPLSSGETTLLHKLVGPDGTERDRRVAHSQVVAPGSESHTTKSISTRVRRELPRLEDKLRRAGHPGHIEVGKGWSSFTTLPRQLAEGGADAEVAGFELFRDSDIRAGGKLRFGEHEVVLNRGQARAFEYLMKHPGEPLTHTEWQELSSSNLGPIDGRRNLMEKIAEVNELAPNGEPVFIVDGSGNAHQFMVPDLSKPAIVLSDGLEFDTAYGTLRTRERTVELNRREAIILESLLTMPDTADSKVWSGDIPILGEGADRNSVLEAVKTHFPGLEQKLVEAGFPGHVEHGYGWARLKESPSEAVA